jgi:glycosyltransferase involved in cell wall biosynthesis
MSRLRNRVYYSVKPFIPQSLRTALRRRLALRLRSGLADVWPIMPGSERPPENWPGWPEGKKFAVVLTHDVEGQAGLDKCRDLMRLELELGFRSSFNFIPEGGYAVPADLREELVRNGFEVGVHDLKHDGRLYRSRRGFKQRAARINRYLSEWGAAGFRSAFMLNELDWLHELDIRYDASTFDTDPFEPQPEGRHTIFPFWVPAPRAQKSDLSSDFRHSSFDIRHSAGRAGGYVELPYTVPQDSTLFLLLREETSRIWLRKLDWIAEHGGMALVIIHPDYIDFSSKNGSTNSYPAARVREFLSYISVKFAGEFWNPSCRELSAWYTGVHHRLLQRPLQTEGLRHDHAAPAVTPALAGKRAAVLLYSYYPADPRPRRAAEALVEAGMEVDLVCLREKAIEKKRDLIDSVRIIRLPLRKRRDSKRTYILQYASFLAACFGLLTFRSLKNRYDLVHVHNMPDVLVFGALIPKLLGARVILDLHDPMPELMMSIYNLTAEKRVVRWLKRLEKLSISFADLVLTPNKAFRDLFISRGCPPEKIEIIMNSPDSRIFHSSRYSSPPPTVANGEKPFKIMYHGLIAARHGLDIALETMAKLQSTIPALEFHIFGSHTPYMSEIEADVRRLGLCNNVHYHGYRPQSEIAKSICSVDLGIIPNRRNQFTEINMPTRIFEYLAMGRPVVVPNTRGIRDYFGPQSALFFEPDDPQSLADVILQVYRNPQRVEAILAQGQTVYQAHRWETDKGHFLNRIGVLLLNKRGRAHS